jgi:hypothetical protein
MQPAVPAAAGHESSLVDLFRSPRSCPRRGMEVALHPGSRVLCAYLPS